MIEIKNFCKSYGEKIVYNNFNLSLEENKITCILGESGCGKTTLLNAVAGLVDYSGEITPVKVSYVFQSPRLVPNLTVLNNLVLVGAEREKALAMLDEVGLGGKQGAYPLKLSGGEAQRVALCRAFLHPCDVMLLDEPFSSLDLKTKGAVMELFTRLCASARQTAVFVTHDIDEALYISDRIVVIKNGGMAADFLNGERGGYGENSPLRERVYKALLS